MCLQEASTSCLHRLRKARVKLPKYFVAVDVSSVVDAVHEDMAIHHPQSSELDELADSVSRQADFYLGVAALPLTVRSLEDGRTVVLSTSETVQHDEAFAARQLRNCMVVCMLDAVQSVQWLAGPDVASPEVVDVSMDGGSPCLCLPRSEVRA
jgi:hypothetical protein